MIIMSRYLKKNKVMTLLAGALALVLFFVFQAGAGMLQPAAAGNGQFERVEGDLDWQGGVSADRGQGAWELVFPDGRRPQKLQWSWAGAGRAWASVKYSDGNVIYYVLAGSAPPEARNSTYIDQNGVPRIIVPVMLELSEGMVTVDLPADYRRYCGKGEVSVENVRFGVDASGHTEIKEFAVLAYMPKKGAGGGSRASLQKGIYLQAQAPQGNEGRFYLVKGLESPVLVKLRVLLEGKTKGDLTVSFPETVTITSFDRSKMQLVDGHTLVVPLEMGPGYAEESIVVLAKASGPGQVAIKARLGVHEETVSGELACPELEFIRNNVQLLDEGVYPVQHKQDSHKVTIRKELKNYIKIKEDIFSSVHKLFGTGEKYDEPAGVVYGVLQNGTGFDLPLHVRFSVLDRSGREITYFRGEHIQREGADAPPVPETVLGVADAATGSFKMPLFADMYSVKPGTYGGVLRVSLFGSDAEIANRNFDLNVKKDSQIKTAAFLAAVFLSLISVLLLVFKHKKWIGRLRTSEIILIALFTAVKFSIVDVPWFIFGDVVRAAAGPLGPFMHIFTGIFWDILNSLFLVALIVLIPRSGVVIISSVVRIILQGVAFGSFNPVSILLMLSYAALADMLLYLAGFTSGKREFRESPAVLATLAVIFAVQHIYSTYISYYMHIYLYRLFFPDWYININVLVSVVYSGLGAVLGVYLGNKLRRVIE